MKKSYENYNTGTIQQTCGFPEPTEKQMGRLSEQASDGHRQFFIKRGLPVPDVSRHYIAPSVEFEIPEPELQTF